MNIKPQPIPVNRALRKLGHDLKNSRKMRRITMDMAAERAGISRNTLSKIENGDGGVSIMAYAKILFVYGMIDRIHDLCDPKFDTIGMGIELDQLPKRIRHPKQSGE